MHRRSTIGDVAKAAGVSVATVSRVLNDGPVRAQTAERVREVIARLGFTPNALTRSVFSGRSSTLGVVVPDLRSPFVLEVLRGIDESAAERGGLVLLGTTSGRAEREPAQVRAMDEQRVAGLVVVGGAAADEHTRQLAESGTPCVVVGRALPAGAGVHSVALDDDAAGRLMADHLLDCGRTSIGVVAPAAEASRVAGLRAALARRRVELPDGALTTASGEAEIDAAVMLLLMHARDRGAPLDAIVCLAGGLAAATYEALTSRGIRIPADLAFLAMDEFAWGAALGVTVLAQPAREMGRRAAELVAGPPGVPEQVVFRPALVARKSCGEK